MMLLLLLLLLPCLLGPILLCTRVNWRVQMCVLTPS